MDYSKISNFDDVYVQTKNLTKKQKGDFFEEFTYRLFKLDPRINNGLENIWLYPDVPSKIIKELNLPTKDKGIDLLAKINDDYYAIQCKFRQNPNVILNWSELSTFFGLAFGMNNKIKGGFLVTNTMDLCKEVIKSTKVEPIYGDYFVDLPKNFFRCFQKSMPIYNQKYPFIHQSKCKLCCLAHFIDHSRGHIEMACGSGKTLTSYWIDSGLSNRLTVIFVPSLYLLSQFYSDWVNQSYAEKKQIKYLLIGSDADVDEDIKYKSNGLILYTNPKSIRKFIRATKEKLVIISTYQSSDKLAEACRNIEIDFGIFDESHKTVGQVGKKFTMMLTNKHMTIKKRLFMTATPKMYACDLDNEKYISMNDEKFYGPKLYVYNTGNAIVDKKLVDYQVMSIYTKNNSIEKLIKKNRLVKLKKEFDEMEANYLATILVILKKIKDGTCRHLITYHNKVESARKFSEYLDIVNGKIYSDDKLFVWHLSGQTSMVERNCIIKEFVKSPVGILCSARVLNEGVNIPIVDSVCFVDARFSTIDIVQCIGRSLRLYDDKSMAHVIVPTFIKDFNEDLDKDAYGNVIRILKALKSTDDGVVEYFKMKKHGKKGCRQIVAGEYFDEEIYAREIDLDKWNDTIGEKVWRMVDGFEYMYEKVKKWVDNNKKIPADSSKNEIERNFGQWCCDKRKYKRNGKLDEYKVNKLEKIDGWYWDKEDPFNLRYSELLKWINNNKRIPLQHGDDFIEVSLGRWCSGIRSKKQKNKLSDNKIKLFNKIPEWYWLNENSFDMIYNKLLEWITINDKFPIMTNNDMEEKKLAVWCGKQRQKYRKNELKKEKINKLEKIPYWYWDKQEPFYEKYNELKKWIGINKRLPSQHSNDIIESFLGRWCVNKRQGYKRNELKKEYIDKLDKISEWCWNNNNESFDKKYLELCNWIKINDRMPQITKNNDIERKLAYWCSGQRKYKNNMSEKNIKKLERINGWYWNKFNDGFNDNYNELKQWVKQNNKLPCRNVRDMNENKLSVWCGNKRKNKRNGILTNEQIKKLEKIPGWYWGRDIPKKTRTFENVYNELKKWVTNNNKLPNRNSKDEIERKLGSWCINKRHNAKKNILKNEEIINLEKIPGWFWKMDDPFDRRYNELKKWIDNNNRLPSANSKDKNEKSLGYWCNDRRKNKKQGNLNEYEIKKLQKIPGWFWSDDTKIVQIKSFNERYNELQKWVKKNKKLPSHHSKNKIEKNLGNWCRGQKKNKQHKKLSDDKIKLLEKIPGWYWTKNQKKYPGSKTGVAKSL